MERDELQAIVDKLPKTADGVTVLPGMYLYFDDCTGYVQEVIVNYQYDMYDTTTWPSEWHRRFEDCYSTHAAADAAMKGQA